MLFREMTNFGIVNRVAKDVIATQNCGSALPNTDEERAEWISQAKTS